MPNPFFYLRDKFLNKNPAKPINSAQYAAVGEELLNIIAQLRKDVFELKEAQQVRTHYDHTEELARIKEHIRWNSINIEGLNNRLKELENKDISTLVRRIHAPNWQRPRRKDGRWIKGGGNVQSK